MSVSGSAPPNRSTPIRPATLPSTHHTGRRSATGGTTAGVDCIAERTDRCEYMEMSVRSSSPVAGSTWVASSVISFSITSTTTSASSLRNAARTRSGSGSAPIGLPPVTNRTRTLPASISSARATAGTWSTTRGSSGRLDGPGNGDRRAGRGGGRCRDSAAGDPHPAGMVERPRGDEQDPLQPLDEDAVGAHVATRYRTTPRSVPGGRGDPRPGSSARRRRCRRRSRRGRP